jgi:benzoate/toluate 1,2-dioxygenase alpha subunit
MSAPAPQSNDELQMRTWWREWNRIMTGEDLPPEPHDELSERYAGQREVSPDTEAVASS